MILSQHHCNGKMKVSLEMLKITTTWVDMKRKFKKFSFELLVSLSLSKKWKYAMGKLSDYWLKVNHWFESVWRKHLGKTQHNGTNLSKSWLWFEFDGWGNLEEKDWQCH